MDFPLLILAAILLIYKAYQRLTRISISKVQGPEPESFLLGLSIFRIWRQNLIFRRQYARIPSKPSRRGMCQEIGKGLHLFNVQHGITGRLQMAGDVRGCCQSQGLPRGECDIWAATTNRY